VPSQHRQAKQTNKEKQTQTNNRSLPAAGAKPTPPGWNKQTNKNKQTQTNNRSLPTLLPPLRRQAGTNKQTNKQKQTNTNKQQVTAHTAADAEALGNQQITAHAAAEPKETTGSLSLSLSLPLERFSMSLKVLWTPPPGQT
jgi:hypothetical protein